MKIIAWETPPPKRTGAATQHVALADMLRSRPGEWALIHVGKSRSSVTSMISTGKGVFGPKGAFQQAVRKSPEDGLFRTWVRFTGGDDS